MLVVGTEGAVPSETVVIPAATALQAADVPDGRRRHLGRHDRRPGARRSASQPVRDSDLAAHGVDGRRPRPARGTDHRRARDVRPLPRPADGRGTTATDPTPNPSRIRSTRDPGRDGGPGRRLAAAGLVAVVVALSALSVFAAAAAAGAATPRTGRVLIISLPDVEWADFSEASHRPISTGCSSSRPSAPWSPTASTARRRSPSGYVTMGAGAARDRQRFDRRPGLRRRRGLRARPGRRGVHHPHRHPARRRTRVHADHRDHRDQRRRALRRRGRASSATSSPAPASPASVIANGDGSDPSTPETAVLAVAARARSRRS